jgi:hypothetical protein
MEDEWEFWLLQRGEGRYRCRHRDLRPSLRHEPSRLDRYRKPGLQPVLWKCDPILVPGGGRRDSPDRRGDERA